MSSYIVLLPFYLSLAGLFLSDALLTRNFNPLHFFLSAVSPPHRGRSTLCQPLADSGVPMNCGSFFILKKISLLTVKDCLRTYQMKPVEFLVPSKACYGISLSLQKMFLPINVKISMQSSNQKSLLRT